MKPRQQRMLAVGLAALGVAIAAGLTLRAFEDNMMFYVDISEVVAGNYPEDRNFRIGGLVVAGTFERNDLEARFRVSDLRCELDVSYTGVLPDLFREGQTVVAHGHMEQGMLFVADKILAKHDENYMAPEVAESMAKHVQEKTASLRANEAECDYQ